MKINTVALVGFGAIGCVYAKNLNKNLRQNFAVIAGGSRGERIKAAGAVVNGEKVMPTVGKRRNKSLLSRQYRSLRHRYGY